MEMRALLGIGTLLLLIVEALVVYRGLSGFGLHEPTTARVHQAQADMEVLRGGVVALQQATERCQKNLGEIVQDRFPSSRLLTLPRDPWGRPYNHDTRGCSGEKPFWIRTNGADGASGGTGEDRDIRVP
jgi:Type II secretion system (T2SS), protein G